MDDLEIRQLFIMYILYPGQELQTQNIEEPGKKVLISTIRALSVFYLSTLKDKVLLCKKNSRLSVTIYAVSAMAAMPN